MTVALGECLRKVEYHEEKTQASTSALLRGGKPVPALVEAIGLSMDARRVQR